MAQERVLVLDDAANKLLVHNAVGTTAPPVGTVGADLAAWKVGAYTPRRAVLRFTASGALNLTAGSVWVQFDTGVWAKLATIANLTFVAGDLVALVVVDFPIGARLACAFTLSAGTVTVHAFPLEAYVC
jgi:hypothetical protein